MTGTAAEPLPEEVARALANFGPAAAAADVRYFSTVGSTNDIALALAEDGAADGTTVLADTQQAGRGRRGREWHSPAGVGVYLSTIVRPCDWPGELGVVTLAAGVAVARAVRRASGLPVGLKWPNDVVMGRPWRKLGGLLCESVVAGGRLDAVVIGVGINVRPTPYPAELGRRATSIEAELGRQVDRPALVAALVGEFAGLVSRLRAGDTHQVLSEWRALAAAGLGGAPVRWVDRTGERRGVALDVDEAGGLIVEANGTHERLIAGEVTWERLSG